MDILTEYLVKTKTRLTYEKLLSYVWHDKQVQDKIIELNTIGQLFNKSIDSLGDGLIDQSTGEKGGKYKGRTQAIAEREGIYNKIAGQPYNFDWSGYFFQSFSILVSGVNAEILADPIKIQKGQRIDLFEKYGEDIVGLTEFSKQELREVIRIPIQRFNKRGLSVN